MAVKWIALLAPLLGLPAIGRVQPALPPQERPPVVATIADAGQGDGIVLEGGKAAPLGKDVELRGVDGIDGLGPGDLVELVQDENGLVHRITVLPRLAQRRPLAEVIAGNTPASFFWWRHEGEDYANSIYAADATVRLTVPSLALEATIAYLAAADEAPATFAVLGPDEAPLWQTQLAPGSTAQLQCSLGKAATIALRCRRSDGSVPDHTHCIWGSPEVLLQELGSTPLRPEVAAEIADGLAGALGAIDPGKIGVARPRVVGLSDALAVDLQQDLFVALGSRYQLAGMTSVSLSPELTDHDPGPAADLAADSLVAAEIRYAPEGSVARVALISAGGGEILAQTQATIQP
jgi:hypothetical protein